ncbi:hypothetical protein [Capnocytophaga catalasegens]|nr:hypothetical protein [Capnocytophaga catalasegens]
MINRKIITLLFVLMASVIYAQKNTNSPYSYYGLGEIRFGGNTENSLMGGINSYVDSLRVDVRNPASLGKLQLTTFSLSASADFRKLESNASLEQVRTTTIDYLALSFPVYKNAGVSFGLSPYSSVGYKLASLSTENGNSITQTFEGNGGLNRLYMAVGYEFVKNLRIGVGAYFNFGKTEIQNMRSETNVSYIVNESSNSTYRGASFNFGVQYNYKVWDKYVLGTTLSYTPKSTITSTNSRVLSTLFPSYTRGLIIRDTQTLDLGSNAKTNLTLPSELNAGIGFGQEKKWYIGADYTLVNNNEFDNPFITSTFVAYDKGHKFALGGFFIPQYNSFTKYWKRITYRAGMYYENTGIVLHNEKINDFGITFGLSLPVQGFSNVTLGTQIGSKGTKSQNLIKENYFNIKIALTLNDKWFQKSKYN